MSSTAQRFKRRNLPRDCLNHGAQWKQNYPRTTISISCHIYSAVIFIWQLVPVRHGHFEVAIWIWTIWKCFNKNLSDLSSFLTVRRFGRKLKKKESKIWMIIQVIKCRQEMVAKKKKEKKNATLLQMIGVRFWNRHLV